MRYRQLTQTQRYQIHARFDSPTAGLKLRAPGWARSKITNRVGIEHRPAEVDGRRFISHWEGDTLIQGHKQSGLVTLVERRSGYLLAARLPSKRP
ncbi:MAG: hypothetical protein GYB17_09580 [Gammaproteobacteria bacterium]|nr:hypothetical protein [Gammaproteobacteria bacterium]